MNRPWLANFYTRQNSDFLDQAQWPLQFEWLKSRLETMHKVFSSIMKNLKVEPAE
jgi:hypothetical protein